LVRLNKVKPVSDSSLPSSRLMVGCEVRNRAAAAVALPAVMTAQNISICLKFSDAMAILASVMVSF
jgi:hypothetical protein